MGEIRGLLCALGAAVAFGVQYVPVKRYEIYDGAVFQWFMCSGILMAGFLVAFFSGDLGGHACCSDLVVLGGVLWALSNYLVLPLVKLLGIGIGFSLYHFVNLIVGYAVGRFGLFGVPRLQGSLVPCDVGCCLILVSFVVMVFVEVDGGDGPEPRDGAALTPPEFVGVDQAYREHYRKWRLGDAHGAKDPKQALLDYAGCVVFEVISMERGGGQYHSTQGFSVRDAPRLPRLKPGPARAASDRGPMSAQLLGGGGSSSSSAPPQQSMRNTSVRVNMKLIGTRVSMKLIGACLAVAGGGLCGVQSVPATLHNEANPGQSSTAVVFPQCLGIWVASSSIYLAYATVAWLCRWPVPHSVIRPAYASGCIWAAGFTLMIGGIRDLGYSVGYTLDAVGPIVVSSLLSMLVFQEIAGRLQVGLYCLAFALQLTGVLLIAAFGQAPG